MNDDSNNLQFLPFSRIEQVLASIMLTLIIFNAIFLYCSLDSLPNLIGIHFDINEYPDRWVSKREYTIISYWSQLILLGLFICLRHSKLFFLSVKCKIDLSLSRNIVRRQHQILREASHWSTFIFFVLGTIQNYQMIQVAMKKSDRMNSDFFLPTMFFTVFLIIYYYYKFYRVAR
jgi:uncharacterized membrane protein